jgi:hypothetical protein
METTHTTKINGKIYTVRYVGWLAKGRTIFYDDSLEIFIGR